MKPERIVNEDLLAGVRMQPCTACNKRPPSDAHHVKHQGAGGGDTEDNVMPLCRFCHQDWHALGAGRMIKRNPSVGEWLVKYKRMDIIARAAR